MRCPSDSSQSSCDWGAAVANLPIAFAQVREDPAIDLELVRRLRQPARILMVASGGDTACYLANLPLGELHLVDVNEAQLNLTRFKLHLMGNETTQRRLEILGHLPMSVDQRSEVMQKCFTDLKLPAEAFGPVEMVARYGADHCGRYECLFARMRDLLQKQRQKIECLMRLNDPVEQARMIEDGTEFATAIKTAFSEIMDLRLLIQVFGAGATANRVQPFADHFFQQTRQVLCNQAAIKNPFLHQIFLGSFLEELWPWHTAALSTDPSRIRFTQGTMNALLKDIPDGSVDFVHLSNILDWSDPADACQMLSDAWRSLSIGGLVIIRQLNSRLDIRNLPGDFQWLENESSRLHQHDRSFFYRQLHVGAKR